MASADWKIELKCSVCTETFTDAVTLRCGHTFCLVCITETWNHQDDGEYSCPECRERFPKKPELRKNPRLDNLAEHFRTLRFSSGCGLNFCTNCIHSYIPAVKTCLHCEAHLCEDHMKVHNKSPEHILTEPTTILEDRKCPDHKKILEYYCTQDGVCICVTCAVVGGHRGHNMESIQESSKKKKKKLKHFRKKLTLQMKNSEKKLQILREIMRKEKEKAEGKRQKITTMLRDIRKHLKDLEIKMLHEISKLENKITLTFSDQIEQLEMKMTELSRKISYIHDLRDLTDPLTLVQEQESTRKDFVMPEDGSLKNYDFLYEESDLDEGQISETLHMGLSDVVSLIANEMHGKKASQILLDMDTIQKSIHFPGELQTTSWSDVTPTHNQTLMRGHIHGDKASQILLDKDTIQKNIHFPGDLQTTSRSDVAPTHNQTLMRGHIHGDKASQILLDVATAGNSIDISGDLKTASSSDKPLNRIQTLGRFENFQVISIDRFASGRHYWEIESSIEGNWRVGMTYPSIDRRGAHSHIGCNNKSWCLRRFKSQYSVVEDQEVTMLHQHQVLSQRIGIYVDYEAGQLSFYELCDPNRHLHTFTAAFSEPLHAALCVYKGWVKISS